MSGFAKALIGSAVGAWLLGGAAAYCDHIGEDWLTPFFAVPAVMLGFAAFWLFIEIM